MKKILVLLFLILFIGQAAISQNKDKTYILVHGAWHGAWCWYKVVPIMEKKGYKVLAIDLPSHGKDTTNPEEVTLKSYVNKVKEIAKNIKGQVILVGHSMSGTVISQAAEELGTEKVFKLIYLDAFLPKDGESLLSLAELIILTLPNYGKDGNVTIQQGQVMNETSTVSTFKSEIADILFYHDCNQKDKEFAHENFSRQSIAPLVTPVKVTDNVYGKIPKYYILCTESKDLNKAILPTRVKCEKIIKMNTSHSPFFSKPKELAKILMTM
jgi:pimeloyl-ACP methyl ester carboxylesterase